MKTLPVFAIVIVSALIATMGFRFKATPPDLTSPEHTVRSFLNALIHGDFRTMARCVQNGQDEADLPESFRFPSPSGKSGIEAVKAQVDGESAKVTVKMRGWPDANATLSTETFDLQKENGVWLIVPDQQLLASMKHPDQEAQRQFMARPIAGIATLMGGGKEALPILRVVIEVARAKVVTIQCLSNAKQIGLATLMYAQDHDFNWVHSV
jgi:hypothetical protein